MKEDKKVWFKKTSNDSCSVMNKRGHFLGEIRRKRISFYYHWCFLPVAKNRIGEVWLTNGVLKQISAEIQRLYGYRRVPEYDEEPPELSKYYQTPNQIKKRELYDHDI